MEETTFNREFSTIEIVNNSLHKKDTMLNFLNENYIKEGKVFLAFRNHGNIMGYCFGGKLFDLKIKKEGTEIKPTSTASYLKNTKKQELFFIENEPTFDAEKRSIYKTIIDNMHGIRNKSEVCAVSGLYKFSPMSKYVQNGDDCVLLDIEADFAIPEKGEKENRVDVVLYNPVLGQLMFVEVKLLENEELLQHGETEPHIIDQLQRYSLIVKNNKSLICREYNKVIDYYNKLSGKNLQSINSEKEVKLGLLITGYNNEDKHSEYVSNLMKDLRNRCGKIKNNLSDVKIFGIGNIENVSQNTFQKWFN